MRSTVWCKMFRHWEFREPKLVEGNTCARELSNGAQVLGCGTFRFFVLSVCRNCAIKAYGFQLEPIFGYFGSLITSMRFIFGRSAVEAVWRQSELLGVPSGKPPPSCHPGYTWQSFFVVEN